MTIQRELTVGNSLTGVMKRTAGAVVGLFETLRGYYSAVLGRDITPRQACALTEAQVAFTVCILPADMPIVARVAFGAWLMVALRKCKKTLRIEH